MLNVIKQKKFKNVYLVWENRMIQEAEEAYERDEATHTLSELLDAHPKLRAAMQHRDKWMRRIDPEKKRMFEHLYSLDKEKYMGFDEYLEEGLRYIYKQRLLSLRLRVILKKIINAEVYMMQEREKDLEHEHIFSCGADILRLEDELDFEVGPLSEECVEDGYLTELDLDAALEESRSV